MTPTTMWSIPSRTATTPSGNMLTAGNNQGTYTIAYDAAGGVSTQTDHGNTVSYTYDNAEELTGANATVYSYNAGGNRSNYTYNANYKNQLTSDGTWTYSYDAEGNETGKTKS